GSDVCSSDLIAGGRPQEPLQRWSRADPEFFLQGGGAGPPLKSRAPRTPGSESSATAAQSGVLHFSVANLDAGSIPNAPISIPNRGASSPIARRPYVDRGQRHTDTAWRIT